MASILSQFRIGEDGSEAERSCKRDCTEFNSMVVEATTWYSVSIEECAIVVYLSTWNQVFTKI